MDWGDEKRELCAPSGHGECGGLTRPAEKLLPARGQSLRSLMYGSMALASDANRKVVAAATANRETWRAQAYQAYWRTQVR